MIEFFKKIANLEIYYEHLATIQWKEGYAYKKWVNTSHCQRIKPHLRRFAPYKYGESPTADTLFYKLKIFFKQAFDIVFGVATDKQGISLYERRSQLNWRQMTCWVFKRKALESMQDRIIDLLKGFLEMDALSVGDPAVGTKGSSKGKKKAVIFAIQKDDHDIHRCPRQVIKGAASKELTPSLKHLISKEAGVNTDSWQRYTAFNSAYPSIEQVPSSVNNSLWLLHRQRMLFQFWLQGIHRIKHLQAYLDDVTYKFNRLKCKNYRFHSLIIKMVKLKIDSYNQF